MRDLVLDSASNSTGGPTLADYSIILGSKDGRESPPDHQSLSVVSAFNIGCLPSLFAGRPGLRLPEKRDTNKLLSIDRKWLG